MLDKLYQITKGWKTISSCLVAGGVAILQYLKLIDDNTAMLIYKLAGVFGLYGVHDATVNPVAK